MVQSIERAFSVLRALAQGPAGVTQLADRVDLPKSTVARLLATLELEGAVEQPAAGGAYRLSTGLVDLAAAVAPGRNLVAMAHPELVNLVRATGEAAGLSVADGYDAHYLAQVETPNPVQVRDWTGERAPLHTVSSGIVMLAYWPGPALDDYLGRDLAKLTRHTETDPAAVRRRLARVRIEGHAWTAEEFAEGITSVAAPVRDESGAVVAALHSHGPTYRFPTGDEARAVSAVMEAAAGLSRRLGEA